MIRGYARVSTVEQNLDLQIAALTAAGCDIGQIFTDRVSGISWAEDRPGFAALLAELVPGDVLMVWRLDRLSRGLQALLVLLTSLSARGVLLRSLTENLDAATASGQLTMQMFGALAEYERALMGERITAGVDAARARGQRFGRPAALSRSQVRAVRMLATVEGLSYRQLAVTFDVSRQTISQVLRREAPYGYEVNEDPPA